MSSFEIGKNEYMKAGGFVAGLLTEFRRHNLYDYDRNCRADRDSYKRWFAECYEMNAKSVADRYNDPECLDEQEYDEEFNEYFGYGKAIAISRDGFREAIAELLSFFNSSLYQTENEEYFAKMQSLYNRIIVVLTEELLHSIETVSWGEFVIKKPKYTYTTIM